MQIRNFIHNETSGGIFLLFSTVLALIFANTSLVGFYETLMIAPIKIGVTVFSNFYGLDKPFSLWVNDLLMTFFFLLLGLEIKRELVAGELSTRSKALQPLFAAVGGVVVPIICYLAVTYTHDEVRHGWAIPCMTDLAFALGILAFLGNRVPPSIKILLTALAIIDDLIAIILIAVFYTDALAWTYLIYVAVGIAALLVLHYSKVMRPALYLVAGAIVWYGLLKTGLHPTLAGVITAFALPLRVEGTPINKSPLVRLEKNLHPYVSFLVVPIFAFSNAGLKLSGITPADIMHPLTMGIAAGLMIGKPIGIMLGLYIGHITGLARKAIQKQWSDYIGMAILCGIGFTMSLFVGDLSFTDPVFTNRVRLGVLGASVIMATLGWTICRFNLTARFKHTI